MTVLSDLKADIADDVDDTTMEYAAAILKAIQGAQRDCERTTYYFNETRDVTFVTVGGQEWYGAAANANIPTLIHIEVAYSEDAQGQRIPLVRRQPAELERLSDNSASTGEPFNWTYFNRQIRLYPIPGTLVFTIRLQLSNYRLTTLSNPGDTNAWLDQAYDMIKARAKYRLYKNTIKDANLAIEALNDWKEQDALLKGETSSRNGSGFIEATRF
jgi:hypothetical protein